MRASSGVRAHDHGTNLGLSSWVCFFEISLGARLRTLHCSLGRWGGPLNSLLYNSVDTRPRFLSFPFGCAGVSEHLTVAP